MKIAGRASHPCRRSGGRSVDPAAPQGLVGGLAHAAALESLANERDPIGHARARCGRRALLMQPKLPEVLPERGRTRATESDGSPHLPPDECRVPVPLPSGVDRVLARDADGLKQSRVRNAQQVVIRHSGVPAVHAQEVERARYGVGIPGRRSVIACTRLKKPMRS